MGRPKKPEYDLDFVRNPGLPPEQVASELSHALRLKGYCTIKLATPKETQASATSEAQAAGKGGLLEPPPEQLWDSLLGPEGSGAMGRLEDIPGEAVASLRARMKEFATMAAASAAGATLPTAREDYLIQGGDSSDVDAQLTEDDCTNWIHTLSRARLMLIYFFGKGQGTLEIKPHEDEEMDSVEFVTEPDALIVLQAEITYHKHVSTRSLFSIVNFVLDEGQSSTRGWNGGITKTFGLVSPAVKELQNWSQDRLEELVALKAEDKLEAPLPREWERMIHHSFFKTDQIPIAVRSIATHQAVSSVPQSWWGGTTCGADMVLEVPFSRWNHDDFYDTTPDSWMESQMYPGGFLKTCVRHVQFIEGVELFDNKFFGLSNMEAGGMDPMQRHIMECSYETLFNAGYRKATLMRAYIAVFVGCTNPEFMYVPHEATALSGAGASQAITSNRVSFLLGIMGPSTSIDCDLASAAMALCLGNSAVSNKHEHRNKSGGTSTAAVVGGVYLCLTPFMWPRWEAFMNPAGRCFSFDNAARGYVVGEGCTMCTLKPYAEKVDGSIVVSDDPYVGTMVGWSMANSGRNAGMAAPCGPAEEEVVAESVRAANCSPLDIDGLECHAEGRVLVDSVELAAAARVLRGCAGGDKEVLITASAKSNTGVQREASTMAPFLKVLLNIAYANNAPSIHLKQLNPYLELGTAAVRINTESMAFRDSRVFHGVGARGWGGMLINIVCWGAADSTVVPLSKPKMYGQSFALWPSLEDSKETEHSYHVVGSWSNWTAPQPMTKSLDGAHTLNVTLGEKGVESFQIWVDGDSSKVLHPSRPQAFSGSRVLGPDPLALIQQYHLNWVIDGRGTSPTSGSSTPALPDAVVRARDAGQPGDQYQIKLLQGRFRAVTWEKVKQAF